MKKPPDLGPAAFPDMSASGVDNREVSRRSAPNQADSQRRLYEHPLFASWSVLEFVVGNNGEDLCRPPFRLLPLVCHEENCPKAPHVVGLSFIRISERRFGAWTLYMAPTWASA